MLLEIQIRIIRCPARRSKWSPNVDSLMAIRDTNRHIGAHS